jgi:tetratricopeptide (TPR) repeat protein
MIDPQHFDKELDQLVSNQDFESIERIATDKQAKDLWPHQKKRLCELLLTHGKELMLQQDRRALGILNAAASHAGEDALIWMVLADAYGVRKENVRCLNLSLDAYEKAYQLGDHSFALHWKWGQAALRLGRLLREEEPFQRAEEKFRQAEGVGEEIRDSKFFWNYGEVWASLGKFSGEAADYRKACQMFDKAGSLGEDSPGFWSSWGRAEFELGKIIGDISCYEEAARLYQNGVMSDSQDYASWRGVAATYARLFQLGAQGKDYDAAVLGFQEASRLDAGQIDLWVEWGSLEVLAGKIFHDPANFDVAITKFNQAAAIDPNDPVVLSRWAEALMCLGGEGEQLELLRQAEEKVMLSLEIQPENAEIWGILGNCLNELGSYFGDESYYFEAMDKFEYALTLDSNHPLLWYGLALSFYAVGELSGDVMMIEKAVELLPKVMLCGGHPHPKFWNDWGVALMRLGEASQNPKYFMAAREKFEEALGKGEIKPGEAGELEEIEVDDEYLYNYGCCLDFLGDFSEDGNEYELAVEVLKRVLEINPDFTPAFYNLGLAYSHLGEVSHEMNLFEQSVHYFQLAEKVDSEDDQLYHDWGVSLLHMAQMAKEEHHSERAEELIHETESKFMHSLKLGNLQAYYHLACLYSIVGQYELALHHLEKGAQNKALPRIEDLLEDEWLEKLREQPIFQHFISHLSQKEEEE